MQTLKIGSSNVLAFLDSGSNAHLIDEHIAKSEGLFKTSERPTSITVVGGGNIRSSRSSYQFNLGPGANGEFFEMNCIGIEAVTTKFNKYDLTEIGMEWSTGKPYIQINKILSYQKRLVAPRFIY